MTCGRWTLFRAGMIFVGKRFSARSPRVSGLRRSIGGANVFYLQELDNVDCPLECIKVVVDPM